jgi:hypothetical protein
MHCDSCALDKASAGATVYGAYKLCNDCLLDFTVALASGRVENVAEFMTRVSGDGDGAPPTDLSGRLERSPIPRPTLQPRDKLMPRNEPL